MRRHRTKSRTGDGVGKRKNFAAIAEPAGRLALNGESWANSRWRTVRRQASQEANVTIDDNDEQTGLVPSWSANERRDGGSGAAEAGRTRRAA